METASARDLVVGAEANRHLSTESSMAAERDPCRRGHRCRSESASLDERQWLTLFHLRRSRGEESDLEVLQPRMPSGERSPSMQQGHEVGRYTAQALLY